MNFHERKAIRKSNNTALHGKKIRELYRELIKDIDFSAFPMEIKIYLTGVNRNFLGISFSAPHRDLGCPYLFNTKRPLIATSNREEALQFIYWSIQNTVLHEVAESFIVDGKRAYDPHGDREDNRLVYNIDIPDKTWPTRVMSELKLEKI